jgi:hypothetical protein
MSIPAHRVFASEAALERGRRLLPGRCLENEVERAIKSGRKTTWVPSWVACPPPLGVGERYVVLDREIGVGCVVRKCRSRLTGQRVWRVIRVLPIRRRRK